MGAVYEAIQAGMDRRVALKVLSPKLMEKPAFLERFRREARAAGSLNHPNMVTVYETGEAGGQHFIAMEFIDGETLRERLKRTGKMPVEEGLGIVRKVAQALHYAWEHGKIIHRDVKPDNIMLTQDGHVKLADLGLAKSIEEDTTVTAVGAGIGTPAYMAPEQSQSAKDVDCRADIYSLGITLFQMLTGQLPFEAETPYAVVTAHLEQPLPDPKSINPMIPQPISDLIHRMCAKKAAQRFQTPGALVEEIDGIIEFGASSSQGKPMRDPFREQATVPALPRRRRARKSKSPVPAILGVVLFLAVAGGLGYLFFGKGTTGKPTTTTTTTTKGVEGQPVLRIQEMFDYAMTYAKEHPDEYAEIIDKFEEVRQKAEGTAYAMKAEDQIREWKEKWDAAGEAEVRKRNELVTKHLAAGEFEKARGVWDDFPESLKTKATQTKIEEALAQIEEALKSLVESVEKEVEALLQKEPKDLTPADLKVLIATKAKALSPPAGLPAEAKKALASLAQEIDECLNGYQESLKAKAAEAFEIFWGRYEVFVKAKKFDDAVTLCRASENLFVVPPLPGGRGEGEEPAGTNEWAPVVKFLIEDAQLLKKLFATAEENLPELKGKTIRIGGMAMRVSDVKGGKVYVKQDEAEMAWDLGKLGDETILMLALLGDKDPKSIARQKALFAFYYGRADEIAARLNEATEAGVDVAFYLSRLTPVLVVTTSPPGADVVLKRMVEGRLVEIGEGALKSPLRQDLDKNSLYRVEVSKEGYASVTETVRTGEGGQHRVSVRLKKQATPTLPSGLVAYYPADGNAQDASGNGHHGTNNGASWTTDRHGKANGAFLFNGRRGFIKIEDREELDTDESFTMCAWIRPNAYGDPAGRSMHLVRKWFSGLPPRGNGDYILALSRNGSLSFQVANGDGGGGAQSLSTKPAVREGTWTHVTATFRRGEMKIYVEGRLQARKVSEVVKRTTVMEYQHDEVTIGAVWDHDCSFDGAIDDIAIYDHALTQAEIQAVMKAKSLATQARPLAGAKINVEDFLGEELEILKAVRDRHGNPIRKGKDKATGLPLEIRHKKTGMHLVFIPAGEFMMGSPADEEGRRPEREGPAHRVEVRKPFYLGKYEVTQAEWQAVMGNNPSKYRDDRNPVHQVTWNRSQDLIKSLNALAPHAGPLPQGGVLQPFSLPTEAQWEYACRAGTTTRFHYGDDPGYRKLGDYAWYEANSGNRPHRVGQKKPNAWGLYDMMGNAREWCEDRWHRNYAGAPSSEVAWTARGDHRRVLRGFMYANPPDRMRSACRTAHDPGNVAEDYGLRVALTIADVAQLPAAAAGGIGADAVAFIKAEFEPINAVRDKHGNPVRKGTDKATGLPVEIRHKKTGMHLVFIPAGEFMMGSPAGEIGRDPKNAAREAPQHRVRLTRPFYMGKYEVTVGQFADFARAQNYTTEAERRGHGRVWDGRAFQTKADASWKNPYFRQKSSNPVVLVTWNDAQAFLKWAGGEQERLSFPTEAQWEHACRAGTTSRFHFGDDPNYKLLSGYAWYRDNSGNATHPAGTRKPNQWHLYDMIGNAHEWTADWFGAYPNGEQVDPTGPQRGGERVQRGECYQAERQHLRAAKRGMGGPDRAHTYSGFRVALRVPDAGELPGAGADAGVGPEAVAFIKAEFEPINAVRDRHGNPIRKGTDKATGLPLEIRHRKTGMYFVFIPAGTFMMGSPAGEPDRRADRERLHRVTLTKPFYIGKYETTAGEFARFVEDTQYVTEAERTGKGQVRDGNDWVWTEGVDWKRPNYKQGKEHPVVLLSRSDATRFTEWLGRKESRYALPTEAQWEYACRAGTNTAHYFGPAPTPRVAEQYEWLGTNSGGKPHPVGQKKPNPWGLYDTLGNVMEWVSDWYGTYPANEQTDPTGPERGGNGIKRGSGFSGILATCRCANRSYDRPSLRCTVVGFRVAVSLE